MNWLLVVLPPRTSLKVAALFCFLFYGFIGLALTRWDGRGRK